MDREQLYKICIAGHMLPTEARRLSAPKVNQYSSELQDVNVIWKSGVIQKALRKRAITVNNLRAMGLSDRAIIGTIAQWYRGKKGDSSTWLFVKATYNVQQKDVHSYKMAVRARARAMVNKLGLSTGIQYGKRIQRPTGSNLFIRPQDKFPSF